MRRPIVFVPEPVSPEGIKRLSEHCEVIAPWKDRKPPGEIPEMSEAVLVRIYPINAERITNAPNLKVVAKHGVGLDNIDISCASRNNVTVVWTPNANAESVSQHTIALMLTLSNRIIDANKGLISGHFDERMQWASTETNERTLGIIGLGRIGSRTANKAAHGLGMNVIAFDPYVKREEYHGPAKWVDSLDEILSSSDFITLHVPLTDETRNMINANNLTKVRKGSYIINTSRGPVVDTEAIALSLQSKHLAGAAIDVFPKEPPDLDHPIMSAPNTVLTPHVAGLSDRALIQAATDAADGIIDVIQGRHPRYQVNSFD